ncbi:MULTISPECIES: DUF4845 domain-containing protein [Undibacterium]|jgi:type II secretory pathway pseudopilin PulG|uniref:DUF4845 domain-containing protein n=1 Tax=Undibacterium umbellatum TaxID=2762300 RepID=A0ABR6ZEA1_9BURK|nr:MULTISPECIES: DUF4845 domain-containing protein [Undibacterium]MBC3909974.1 DUF4845 domain-containing protein [Undibacterium umbellatum]MDP1976933.1 DUF4845 domain-containing protein [Undibacterium sp.]
MSKNQHFSAQKQKGITLIGLLMAMAVVIVVAMVAMKVVPTMIEYNSISKAINSTKNSGSTPREIQVAFDRQKEVGYFDAVSGKDLIITRNTDGGFDLHFSYAKKIPLVGPASILMEYSGTTAKNGIVVTKPVKAD